MFVGLTLYDKNGEEVFSNKRLPPYSIGSIEFNVNVDAIISSFEKGPTSDVDGQNGWIIEQSAKYHSDKYSPMVRLYPLKYNYKYFLINKFSDDLEETDLYVPVQNSIGNNATFDNKFGNRLWNIFDGEWFITCGKLHLAQLKEGVKHTDVIASATLGSYQDPANEYLKIGIHTPAYTCVQGQITINYNRLFIRKTDFAPLIADMAYKQTINSSKNYQLFSQAPGILWIPSITYLVYHKGMFE